MLGVLGLIPDCGSDVAISGAFTSALALAINVLSASEDVPCLLNDVTKCVLAILTRIQMLRLQA